MGKKGITIIAIILVVIGLGIGSYFLFLWEKCSSEEVLDPYTEECVSKSVFCNLDQNCPLLEGQTASFIGEDLKFTLISASEGQISDFNDDTAKINIEGLGQVNLVSKFENSETSFMDYRIVFQAADGDPDKIMGAIFEITKTPQIIDCGISESLNSDTPVDQIDYELDDGLICLGNSLLEDCKPSKVTMQSSNSGQIHYEIKKQDQTCLVKLEYGDEDQIPLEEQKPYANKYAECPVDLEQFKSQSDADTSTIPGTFAFSVYFLTALDLIDPDTECTGTLIDALN